MYPYSTSSSTTPSCLVCIVCIHVCTLARGRRFPAGSNAVDSHRIILRIAESYSRTSSYFLQIDSITG